MNREILFKAKRLVNGKWVEGLPSYDTDGNITEMERCRESNERGLVFVEIDPSTICQYTGLPDKSGKKIWENDICIIHSSFIDEEDGYFTVEWDNEGARFALYGDGLTVNFDNYYGYECEVIGNIFDNPELLGSNLVNSQEVF